jgi:hypothetical protein
LNTHFIGGLLLAVFAGSGIPATLQSPATSETLVATDSIDLYKPDVNAGKSVNLAMAASVLLPGTGHQYLDRNRSAFVYLSAEAISVFSYFFCNHYANKTAQEAAGFAWVHARASGPIHDADDHRWKLIGNFLDVQEYNNVMDLNRTPEDRITDPTQAWYWDDQSSQDRFNKIRTTSRSYRIISNFFIGAMVLNRVVAFIDVRTTSRNKGIRQSALPFRDLTPVVNATPNSVDFALSGSF